MSNRALARYFLSLTTNERKIESEVIVVMKKYSESLGENHDYRPPVSH
jgi:hypothetical protein